MPGPVAFRLAFPAVLALLLALPGVLNLFYVRLLSEILVWALLALSLDLLMGYLGLVSFAHAALAGVGAYSMGLLINRGLDPWAALALGVATATAVGLVMGVFSVRVRDIYFGIVTLVFGTIAFIVVWTWTEVTGGEDGLRVRVQELGLFGLGRLDLRDVWTAYYVTLVAVAACYLLARRIVASPLGRVFQAIRENEERTRFMGYATDRYKVAGAAISAAFAGLAGCLYLLRAGVIGADFLHVLKSGVVVIWALVGGMGTLVGPMLGAALVTYLTDLFSNWTENYLILVGLLFVAAVLFLPHGIVGFLQERLGRAPQGGQP